MFWEGELDMSGFDFNNLQPAAEPARLPSWWDGEGTRYDDPNEVSRNQYANGGLINLLSRR